MLSEGKRTLGYEQEYSGSTSNVIKNVLLGKADAGAVFATELDKETPEVRGRLRAIYVTPRIAPHPISAHPRVPRSIQDSLRKAVLALASDAAGADLLNSLRLPLPVAADYARDYRDLEVVDIDTLTNWSE